ncbi:PadR family transcriptional regulator [Pseudonocardia sp. MH-G8]|uniref:PadR family transcriptional regulator n=1 Tax=Pseudonocardia sp. MH-G8 TaxID=1854588 RepID=UPI00130435D0|nr:PadR family transcriptional regulator [Pseudonocardia sp. MH-G8]
MPHSRSAPARSAARTPISPVRTPRRPVEVRDRRHVDLLLLATAATGPANGRELVDRVRERSGGLFTLPLPVVTHQLHRLTTNRLVQVTGDRGAQRRYSLTPLGERVLATRRREWEAFARGSTGVLDAAE